MTKVLFDATSYKDKNSKQLDEDFDSLLGMLQQYKLNVEKNSSSKLPTYILLCDKYKWGASRCIKTWKEALQNLKPLNKLIVFIDDGILYFGFKNDNTSQIEPDKYSLRLVSDTTMNRLTSKYGFGTDLLYQLTQKYQDNPSKFSIPRQHYYNK